MKESIYDLIIDYWIKPENRVRFMEICGNYSYEEIETAKKEELEVINGNDKFE